MWLYIQSGLRRRQFDDVNGSIPWQDLAGERYERHDWQECNISAEGMRAGVSMCQISNEWCCVGGRGSCAPGSAWHLHDVLKISNYWTALRIGSPSQSAVRFGVLQVLSIL